MALLITKNGGEMSSVNFIRLLKSAFSDGIIDGCEITKSGSTLTIGAGFLIAGGAYVEIGDATVDISSSGELIIRIDTTSDTPAGMQIRTVQDLIQQDLANGGTVYEMRLATFTYTSGTISNLTVSASKISPQNNTSEIYVQSAQPTSPNTGDLWFW